MKKVSVSVKKNINMAAPVLLKLFSAQTHYISLPGEPTTWPTADPVQKSHHWRAPNILAASSRRHKSDWFI
jgi:hypothetical protein